jgi:Ser/Thr protein kinase RdoA (MazF antagonist)
MSGAYETAVATLVVVPSATRTLLTGGYHNEVWKVRADTGYLIEKVYNEDRSEPNPMYPNRARAEAAALRELSGTGLAPEFVAYHRTGPDGRPRLVYEYVDGRGWTRGTAEVAHLLGRVHRHEVRGRFRRLPASPGAALAHADSMVAATPRVGSGALRELRPLFGGLASRRLAPRLALVHTDCGPGNVIRSPHGALLIDWQCPGIGDPVEDVACVLSPAMMILYGQTPHAEAARREFLDAYPDRYVVDRYLALGSAWHYRIAAYCIFRADRLRVTQPEVSDRYRRALEAEMQLLRSGA